MIFSYFSQLNDDISLNIIFCGKILVENFFVTLVVYDGPGPVILATAHKLGVDFDLETLTIQLKDRENIFFLLDPAHMLKLARNAFKAHIN